MPTTIKDIPISFCKEIGSPNKIADAIKTNTNEALVKGYAELNSSLLTASIQKIDAKNAETKPLNIKGSEKIILISLIKLAKKLVDSTW
ncbi:hypothetical protein VCSRO119_2604 [Vibrio cholerae]|nr:hypothetical protein [Vibrio cholerae]BCN17204.1 hypothetical protein [Vibrio cholerae]BCN21446.1 hypothetical protein [Vibrio cholerae]GHY52365.1 hypothetical protein VCSRO119_2604 [Vibrio cholerae]GIA59099.1 hypothetical protein VCSRO87_2256 [Vibrio cholerae]